MTNEIWEPWECHCTRAKGLRAPEPNTRTLVTEDQPPTYRKETWTCRTCGLSGGVIIVLLPPIELARKATTP